VASVFLYFRLPFLPSYTSLLCSSCKLRTLKTWVVFGVGVGRLSSLEKLLEERGINFSLGHSIDYSPRIKRGNVPEGYGYRDLGGLSLFSYLIFAYVPKLITFSEREDPYGLLNPKDCKPILSDLPVLISTPWESSQATPLSWENGGTLPIQIAIACSPFTQWWAGNSAFPYTALQG
jgi:hypothetical protein